MLVFFGLLLIILIVETAVMSSLPFLFPGLTGLGATLIDALFLTALISLPIYFIAIKPLHKTAGDEKVRAYEALQEKREVIEALFFTSPLAIIAIDRDARVISWNPSAERIFGWRADEVIGRYNPIVPEDKVNEFQNLIRRAIGGERLENMDLRRKRKDGTLLDVSLSTATLRDAHGGAIGIMAVIADNTNRKIAEERLAKSETRLRTIIENEPECVKLLAADGSLLDMNPAGLKMIEADSLEQVKGKSILACIVPEYREAFQALNERVFRGESGSLEFEIIGMKGARRWAQTVSVPLRDPQGGVSALLGVTRDITEQKKLESQLRHAQKMEAVGTLTGGIAHDFNNILTAIVGYGNILKLKMTPHDPLKGYVDQILSSTERAASLTQGLLTFSRKLAISPKPVNLNEIITRVEKLLHRLIGEDIELRTVLAGEDTTIIAESGQIEQVLMNLCTNARDAMPKGGQLVIATEHAELDNEFISAHGYGRPGRYVLLTVTDTGAGMDEKTKEKIFEPFFTTKEVGKGTGLGLSIAYGIIKQHNGYVTVQSEHGKGSTFCMYFPLAEARAQSGEAKKTGVPRGGTETVLLAEDDAMVRDLTKTVLQEFGYHVIEAGDGEEAVSKFREHAEGISLLLLDVMMPRKDGKEAYEEIRKIRPDVRYLFMSGYAESVVRQKGVLAEKNFVLKPVSPGELLKKVREALDG